MWGRERAYSRFGVGKGVAICIKSSNLDPCAGIVDVGRSDARA